MPWTWCGGFFGPTVSETLCRPGALYKNDRIDLKKLRKLICDGKLVPCFVGAEDASPPPPAHDIYCATLQKLLKRKNVECPKLETALNEYEPCPICFLHYPVLNTSRCCRKRVCTECYLQVQTTRTGTATCPFCKLSGFSAKFVGLRSEASREAERLEEQKVIEARIREREEEIARDKQREAERAAQREAGLTNPTPAVTDASAANTAANTTSTSPTGTATSGPARQAAAAAPAGDAAQTGGSGGGGRGGAVQGGANRQQAGAVSPQRGRRVDGAADRTQGGMVSGASSGGGSGSPTRTGQGRNGAQTTTSGGGGRAAQVVSLAQLDARGLALAQQQMEQQANTQQGGNARSAVIMAAARQRAAAAMAGAANAQGGQRGRPRGAVAAAGGIGGYRLTDFVPTGVVDLAVDVDDINDLMLEQAMYESLAASAADALPGQAEDLTLAPRTSTGPTAAGSPGPAINPMTSASQHTELPAMLILEEDHSGSGVPPQNNNRLLTSHNSAVVRSSGGLAASSPSAGNRRSSEAGDNEHHTRGTPSRSARARELSLSGGTGTPAGAGVGGVLGSPGGGGGGRRQAFVAAATPAGPGAAVPVGASQRQLSQAMTEEQQLQLAIRLSLQASADEQQQQQQQGGVHHRAVAVVGSSGGSSPNVGSSKVGSRGSSLVASSPRGMAGSGAGGSAHSPTRSLTATPSTPSRRTSGRLGAAAATTGGQQVVDLGSPRFVPSTVASPFAVTPGSSDGDNVEDEEGETPLISVRGAGSSRNVLSAPSLQLPTSPQHSQGITSCSSHTPTPSNQQNHSTNPTSPLSPFSPTIPCPPTTVLSFPIHPTLPSINSPRIPSHPSPRTASPPVMRKDSKPSPRHTTGSGGNFPTDTLPASPPRAITPSAVGVAGVSGDLVLLPAVGMVGEPLIKGEPLGEGVVLVPRGTATGQVTGNNIGLSGSSIGALSAYHRMDSVSSEDSITQVLQRVTPPIFTTHGSSKLSTSNSNPHMDPQLSTHDSTTTRWQASDPTAQSPWGVTNPIFDLSLPSSANNSVRSDFQYNPDGPAPSSLPAISTDLAASRTSGSRLARVSSGHRALATGLQQGVGAPQLPAPLPAGGVPQQQGQVVVAGSPTAVQIIQPHGMTSSRTVFAGGVVAAPTAEAVAAAQGAAVAHVSMVFAVWDKVTKRTSRNATPERDTTRTVPTTDGADGAATLNLPGVGVEGQPLLSGDVGPSSSSCDSTAPMPAAQQPHVQSLPQQQQLASAVCPATSATGAVVEAFLMDAAADTVGQARRGKGKSRPTSAGTSQKMLVVENPDGSICGAGTEALPDGGGASGVAGGTSGVAGGASGVAGGASGAAAMVPGGSEYGRQFLRAEAARLAADRRRVEGAGYADYADEEYADYANDDYVNYDMSMEVEEEENGRGERGQGGSAMRDVDAVVTQSISDRDAQLRAAFNKHS